MLRIFAGVALSWHRDARCRGMGSEVFYSPDRERGHARKRREDSAKAICQQCPVVMACRDWAISNQELHGIWGGTTADVMML